MRKKKKYVSGARKALMVSQSAAKVVVPHAAPTSGQGPKPGRTVLSDGLPMNEYYYEFKEFADLVERGATESESNSLQTSLTVLEIIDEILSTSLRKA